MIEQTFVMVRPLHVRQAREILAALDYQGQRVLHGLVERVPREIIETHYAEHREKPFYARLIEAHADKPVAIAVYQWENIVARVMDACGATDPSLAGAYTIRAKYSSDSIVRAAAEGRMVDNVIHRSDSVEAAQREIELWCDYMRPVLR